MLRLVLALFLRLIVVAFLACAGLRAIGHGGSAFLILAAFIEAVALVTFGMAAIAGAALVEHLHRPAD